MAKFSDQTLKDTWAVYEAAGYSKVEAAKSLSVGEASIRRRIKAAKERFNYTEPAEQPLSEDTIKKAQQRTVEEDVALHRAKDNERQTRAKYKDLLRANQKLEERIKELEWAAGLELQPAEWATPARSPGKSEHMPYLLISDEQAGEVVDPAETDHSVGYNIELYRRRHRHLIDTAIYLAQQHSGGNWVFPGIIVAFGGDAISGAIHDELAQTDEVTPIEAVEIVFEERAAAINKLREVFGRVDIKSVIGNHGRDTRKPQSKKADQHNHERTINYLLGREFKNTEGVSIQTSRSPDVYFPVYEKNILLTHGDKIGSRGGQGFIGPAATILRGAKKVIMEQAALSRLVDEVHIGHFHTSMRLSWLTSNGCFPGYSEFAKQNRMTPEEPQQFFGFYHPTRGLVDQKTIGLKDA